MTTACSAADRAANASPEVLGADFLLELPVGLALLLRFVLALGGAVTARPVFFEGVFPFEGRAVLLIGTKLSVFWNSSWLRGSVYALDPA